MAFSNPRRRTSASRTGEPTDATLKTSMALRKGATFHSPSSPTATDETNFVPPRLPRSQSHMDDVVDANRRRIALTLTEIDEALAKTENLSLSPKQDNLDTLRDNGSPVPRGFLDLSMVDPKGIKKEQEKRALRPRSARRSHRHASDSGLGSSLASSNETPIDTKSKSQASAAAITRSAATSSAMSPLPSLGPKAVNRIQEHILGPLLEKPSLVDFKPVVLEIPRRIRSKEIVCLRDVQKDLLNMAPAKAKSATLFLDFALTSIQCIQATVEYLSDREQIRPGDRPYTNGYFIDLKEQLCQYGRELAALKEGINNDDMDLDQSDEVRLIGGFAEHGRPAELVRVKKDGTAISMATGKPVSLHDGPTQVKRSLSEVREDEEEIMRSMARRKKNASPEELAPKRCRHSGCNKQFKRPCDLTKHEKTHSRPWKCPFEACKYHEFGWPTEKEMDRHINDKHSDAPPMYECQFKPCPYKSKRESNCKQHMEKAHGWTYVRTKTNGSSKKSPPKTTSSVEQTPPLGNVSTPSDATSVPTPPQDGAPAAPGDFPLYPADADWLATYGVQPDNLDVDLAMENLSPSSTGSYENFPPYQNGSQFITEEDIYAATVRIPIPQMPQAADMMMYGKMMPQSSMHFGQPQLQPQQQQQQQQHIPAPMATFCNQQEYFQPDQSGSAQFSPNAQQNAMLYTPFDEGDETLSDGFQDSSDFQLFPTNMGKPNSTQPLFGEISNEMPSADLGFSQASQNEMFQQLDLSQLDYNTFHE